MTSSDLPVPPAPTPRTEAQAAAIHGGNAVRDFADEYLVFTLLAPDHPSLPGYPSLDADIAAVRSGIHPSYLHPAGS